MTSPTIDIVIRNYNSEKYLPDAVESALSQDYPNVHVTVVDDGSTDGSRDVIRSYGDQIAAVFQTNGGEGAAINAGWRVRSGEIIIYLDADDVLAPTAVSRVVAVWALDVGRVAYPMRLMNSAGLLADQELPLKQSSPLPIEESLRRFGAPYCGGQSFNAYNQKILEQILPLNPDKWMRAPDKYMSSATSLLGRTVYIQEPLGGYRIHSAAWSVQNLLLAPHRHSVLMINSNLEECLNVLLARASRPRIKLPRPPNHYWLRLASLRLSPESHPYRNDTVRQVLWSGLDAVWKRPLLTYARRMTYSWGLAYTAYAPLPLFKRMFPAMVRVSRRIVTGQVVLSWRRTYRVHWRNAFAHP